MPTATCKKCSSSNLEQNDDAGSLICTDCGTVNEENQIVVEQTWGTDAGGASMMIGQFIGNDGLNNPVSSVGHRSSREMTLRKAKDSIRHLCGQLRLKDYHIDESYRFYKLALNHNFTRGRKAEQVYASCVYLSCRTSTSPTEHMLLDFSEVLRINVFVLGKTFIQLAQVLDQSLPLLDPAFYIYRFAHKLGFAKQAKDVIDTANRIVSRMKRDWMVIGRRPAGICGAAFVMAARMHGFKCNIEDITKVVKIGQNTIRKRLNEFGATPSAKLTIDEFMRIDLETEYDPPAFIKNQSEAAYKIDDSELDDKINDQVRAAENIVPEIEKSLTRDEERKQRLLKRKRKSSSHSDDNEETVVKALTTPEMAALEPSEAIDRLTDNNVSGQLQTTTSNRPDPSSTPGDTPTAGSLGINQSLDEMMRTGTSGKEVSEKETEEDDVELDLEGIDDDEIDMMILKPAEVKRKTEMWETRKENIEWEKREAEKLREEQENPEKAEKKKRRKRAKQVIKEHNTAGDAIKLVEKVKQKSSRINYDVLSTLKEAYLSTKRPKPTTTVTEDVKPAKLDGLKKEDESDESEDEEEEERPKHNKMEGLGDIFGGGDDDYDDDDYD